MEKGEPFMLRVSNPTYSLTNRTENAIRKQDSRDLLFNPRRKRKRSIWTLRRYRDKFKSMDIESLYQRYCVRLKHCLFISLLVVVMAFCTSLVIIDFASPHANHPNSTVQLAVTFSGTILVLIMLVLICFERIFQKFTVPVTLFVWLILLTGTYVYVGFSDARNCMDDVPVIYYIIIVTYTMLPLSQRWAICLGTATGLSQICIAWGFAQRFRDYLEYQEFTMVSWGFDPELFITV
ncbi:adenylate cyclase type 2-like [Lingula anatina]|uniref:Adenylate cyclase type 2-like n=1 Tax=Lingula anatina TaxID=7574 RepID=A0A1S3H2B4_LINAN|nr:adenylate cyclase type 2-like [Lingula anatina]|eukprot:XP_013380270.1 adenylate cyclase type 2-like [Lingula anatina]